ncbi:MAG: rod-binding protein [Spirochaetaceae bacterium]|jgi:flagellar protein FlgJ|nr:rod-binding protein [Spirochaetaceae bacterium]
MDIGALGGHYLEQGRYGVESLGIARRGAGAAGLPAENSFARYLEEAARGNGDPADSAAAKKPVVDKKDKLYEQCLELETFLVKTLIKGMRSTVQKSGLMDTGFAGQMYEDMLYDEYARDFTKNAGFGLAETAYLELTGQRGKLLSSYS